MDRARGVGLGQMHSSIADKLGLGCFLKSGSCAKVNIFRFTCVQDGGEQGSLEVAKGVKDNEGRD